MKPEHKIVNFTIIVPKGKYCWDWHTPGCLCGHFDNEGGHATCDLKFHPLKDSKANGVLKPAVCMKLQEPIDLEKVLKEIQAFVGKSMKGK